MTKEELDEMARLNAKQNVEISARRLNEQLQFPGKSVKVFSQDVRIVLDALGMLK